MKKLAILGASGHGKVVAEIAELNGWEVVFFDDAFPEVDALEHWPVQGTSSEFVEQRTDFSGCFVAIGNNAIRLQKMQQLATYHTFFPKLIHPNAIVSHYAMIGDGSVVMANAVINPFAKIGKGCIINTSATIDHDCELDDAVHISPGANLAGAVKVGKYSWLGIGCRVKQCIQIGAHVIVGAGATVVHDIKETLTVTGTPAKTHS